MIEKLENQEYIEISIKIVDIDNEYVSDVGIYLPENKELTMMELQAISESLKDSKFRIDRIIEKLLMG